MDRQTISQLNHRIVKGIKTFISIFFAISNLIIYDIAIRNHFFQTMHFRFHTKLSNFLQDFGESKPHPVYKIIFAYSSRHTANEVLPGLY